MGWSPRNRAHALDEIFCPKLMKRLLSGLVRDKETGCWIWQRCKDAKGYGKIKWEGRSHWVHRIAYAVLKGPIAEGLTVDHDWEVGCNNRACCNPDHLVLMTQSDNSKKRWEKANEQAECGQ